MMTFGVVAAVFACCALLFSAASIQAFSAFPRQHTSLHCSGSLPVQKKYCLGSRKIRSALSANNEQVDSRRNFVQSLLASSVVVVGVSLNPLVANAGIDVSALKALPVEGDANGAATRLKQLQAEKGTQPQDLEDIPFTKLDNGVSYREFRAGKEGSAGKCETG